jgi:hypothetical protein
LTLLGDGLYFSILLGIIYCFPHTMLAPEENGNQKIISAFSYKFNDTHLKYPVDQQELLAALKEC